eukprot:16008328-Heterocapsa_arctica.AAC.1
MCRGIELSAAECSDSTLNNIRGQVSWSLPVSENQWPAADCSNFMRNVILTQFSWSAPGSALVPPARSKARPHGCARDFTLSYFCTVHVAFCVEMLPLAELLA